MLDMDSAGSLGQTVNGFILHSATTRRLKKAYKCTHESHEVLSKCIRCGYGIVRFVGSLLFDYVLDC